jgi:hypothetical protein
LQSFEFVKTGKKFFAPTPSSAPRWIEYLTPIFSKRAPLAAGGKNKKRACKKNPKHERLSGGRTTILFVFLIKTSSTL